MLKEMFIAGFLFGSVAFPQVRLEHNSKLDSVLRETYCWVSESKAHDPSKYQPSVFEWEDSEKKDIESILEKIPFVKNFEKLKHPIYISKGYTCDGISQTFPREEFSEVLLDTSFFDINFPKYLNSVNVDIPLRRFTKQVLIHELTHVYTEHIKKKTDDESYQDFLSGETIPLAVECFYAIKNGLINTKYFEMRRNALLRDLNAPEEFYGIGNEKEDL